MTALVAQYVNSIGTFLIGILLINPNGTFGPQGAGTVTITANDPASIKTGIDNAAIAYAAGQGYTISASDVVQMLKSPTVRTFANPTRTLNSAFQISTTQDSQVSYAVDIAATLSLVTGQTGTLVLEYADDSGFTTNVVTVQSSVNGNSGSLTLGLNLGQTVTSTVSGMVPASKYVRLRTVNTTGTPTFTFRTSQEVLL